jgi:hypothetical protein
MKRLAETVVVEVTVGLVDEDKMACVGMPVQVVGEIHVMERTWAAPSYRTTGWTI